MVITLRVGRILCDVLGRICNYWVVLLDSIFEWGFFYTNTLFDVSRINGWIIMQNITGLFSEIVYGMSGIIQGVSCSLVNFNLQIEIHCFKNPKQ